MKPWVAVLLVLLALFIGAAGGASLALTQESQLNTIEPEAKDANHAAEHAQREAEDARRAAHQLIRHGIDIFGFGLGHGPFSQLDRIFGERRALRVPRIDVLPQRLVQLYTELKK